MVCFTTSNLPNSTRLAKLLIWFFFSISVATAALQPGDIVITRIQTKTNENLFNFVPLVDIPVGEQIIFTDAGWLESGAFRSSESVLYWTATSTVSAGTSVEVRETEVFFSLVVRTSHGSTSGNMQMTTTGDQWFAYQGDATSPSFLFAIQTNSNQFQSDATSDSTSALPTGLVVGDTALAVGAGPGDGEYYVSAYYNCDVLSSGTAEELRTSIANKDNWIGSSLRIGSGSCGFVVNTAPSTSPTNAPTSSPTIAPTSSPTIAPTFSPTIAPTSSPTQSPTGSPTRAPSASPTGSPTSTPTTGPTSAPSTSPTSSPTRAPSTSSTTKSPTQSPTENPTSSPSSSLTFAAPKTFAGQEYVLIMHTVHEAKGDWLQVLSNSTHYLGTLVGTVQSSDPSTTYYWSLDGRCDTADLEHETQSNAVLVVPKDASPDLCIVTLCVTNSIGQDCDRAQIVLARPTAGSLSGVGRVDHGKNAVAKFPDVSGYVDFELNPHYIDTSVVGQGVLSFHYRNKLQFTFQVDSYDWLVVKSPKCVTFEATGSLLRWGRDARNPNYTLRGRACNRNSGGQLDVSIMRQSDGLLFFDSRGPLPVQGSINIYANIFS